MNLKPLSRQKLESMLARQRAALARMHDDAAEPWVTRSQRRLLDEQIEQQRDVIIAIREEIVRRKTNGR